MIKYTFENFSEEDKNIKLNDRTQKLFFIAENYDKMPDAEQIALAEGLPLEQMLKL
ncbi:hypothetical protein [Treponema sp.]|uniref:hypothetical protein n=1 Tax=Treponema sp. TaxID=166 RepID=UPI00298D7C49|nr:hypothetical protein [Treponema sp.]MCR5612159.1 hypothetical protein [Treponema sp.]